MLQEEWDFDRALIHQRCSDIVTDVEKNIES